MIKVYDTFHSIHGFSNSNKLKEIFFGGEIITVGDVVVISESGKHILLKAILTTFNIFSSNETIEQTLFTIIKYN